MRVLLVSPYPPAHDGIASYTRLIRDELLAQGHEAAVISARPSDVPPPEVLASLPTSPLGSLHLAVSAVRAFAPTVIHIQFAVAAYGALTPALLRFIDQVREIGPPVVVTMHEVTRDTESLRAPGRALYRRVARRADHVVVHTETARTTIEEQIVEGPVSVTVIAHPRAELAASQIGPADLRSRLSLGEDRIVLALGFIDVDKGLEDLIDAAGLMAVRAELDRVSVVVAGEVRRRFGVFRVFELRDRLHLRSLQRKVSQLGLDRQVQFVGFVPSDELRAWFELATVVALPYRRSEQSGVASLAAAAGAPLLTSAVGELGAMSTVRPVPPRDPVALARELNAFLTANVAGSRPATPSPDLAEIVAETTALYDRLGDGNRTLSSAR